MKKLLVILAVLAVLPAASARADGIAVLGNWTSGTAYVTLPYYNNAQVYIGAVPVSLDGAPAFDAYCVSLLDIAPPGTFNYVDPVSMATGYVAHQNVGSHALALAANAGERAAWLYNNYAGMSGVNKGALQIAIWNAVFDTDWSVTSGSGSVFTGDAGLAGFANTYLTSLENHQDGLGADAGYYKLFENGAEVQGFLGPTAVPEPGSMLLLGTGLFGLAGVIRRRLRK